MTSSAAAITISRLESIHESRRNIKAIMDKAARKITDFEQGARTKIVHQQIKMTQYSFLIMNLLGICTCVLWFDCHHALPDSEMNDYLLYASLFCSALLIPISLTHKCLKLKYHKFKVILDVQATIFSTGYFYQFIQDVCIALIMPYSFLKGTSRCCLTPQTIL